jgi:putative transposase
MPINKSGKCYPSYTIRELTIRHGQVREGIEVRFRMIDCRRDAYSVRMMCRHLKVSASGYYEWKNREPSKRDVANCALLTRINGLYDDSDGVMGAPRICEELHYQGIPCGKNRVAQSSLAQRSLSRTPVRRYSAN